MFNEVLNWLTKEGITEQSFTRLDGIVYPSKELIINLHDLLIKYFKGKADEINQGIISEGNIDHVIYHIQYHYWNSGKKEERIYWKAAYMMHYLFTSHTFTDGNKRTGFVTAMLFLSINLFPSPAKVIDYTKNVEFFKKMASGKANDKKDIARIVKWIKKNT